MNKVLIISLFFLFLLTGCINPHLNVSICESNMDLKPDEINLFDGISKQYIQYLNTRNSMELKNHISKTAAIYPEFVDIDNTIDAIKSQFGNFSEKNSLLFSSF